MFVSLWYLPLVKVSKTSMRSGDVFQKFGIIWDAITPLKAWILQIQTTTERHFLNQHPTSRTSRILNIPHLEYPTSRTSHIPNIPYPEHSTSRTSHIPNIPHPEHPTSWTCYIPKIPHPQHPQHPTSPICHFPSIAHYKHVTSCETNHITWIN